MGLTLSGVMGCPREVGKASTSTTTVATRGMLTCSQEAKGRHVLPTMIPRVTVQVRHDTVRTDFRQRALKGVVNK